METQPDSNLTDSNLSKIPSGETWNYEATVAKVETIIRQIETGELELAEVFDQFANAVEYLHQCEDFLAQRQQQMDLLIETLTNDSDF
ncbi:MAG: exodeoxyribonuclease VII small subunit [Moorea sp. SIO3G5]|nr:exodeoxyribonuclease VII small subunit [Moorena sp. SIO3G5]